MTVLGKIKPNQKQMQLFTSWLVLEMLEVIQEKENYIDEQFASRSRKEEY